VSRWHRALLGLAAHVLCWHACLAQAAASSLEAIEQPSSPRLCTAVRTTGNHAADRLNALASDVTVQTKQALDASKGEDTVRDCIAALSSLRFGLDFDLRYPSVGSLLSGVVDRACRFVNQRINDEVNALRSRFGGSGYFGVEGAINRGIGEVDVNTTDSGAYAADCVWDVLNGRRSHCR
jgi:hypothetical protein